MDVLAQAPSQTFDVITMNPPYIPAREVSALDAVVRDHEPHAALTDDADGLTFYRRLHEVAPELLRSGGSMYVELGWGHAEDVACMFADNWTCHVTNDLTGIPRVLELRQP
jgi:release factor glutamine methyltransferase